jgi:hypothetical protein
MEYVGDGMVVIRGPNGFAGWDVAGTGSRLCSVAGFGIGDIELSGLTTRKLVITYWHGL